MCAQSVGTAGDGRGSFRWFVLSLCLQILSQLVADLEEKSQTSNLIRTAANLFTSLPLTHLFLMKPRFI